MSDNATPSERRRELMVRTFHEQLPFWNRLSSEKQELFISESTLHSFNTGDTVYEAHGVCPSLILLISGRLRSIFSHDRTKKITLYWLYESEACVLSACPVLHNVPFEITIVAEDTSELIMIPAEFYLSIQEEYPEMKMFVRQQMNARFSDVMWLVQQVGFQPFPKNLATYLIERSAREGTPLIHVTQAEIAQELGTGRNVVGRTLRQFEKAGFIRLVRGGVFIRDLSALMKASD
ncbi:MAG: Crp/Fnr family transcriptional regulator [Sphaerochaetaceae bacterium]|nr:Crp/Fnr family transcriptional regulator [Sphaerochaetaceae bacterium]